MLAIGLGLGMAMPVLSTASQNAVEFSDLGVVTAAVTFFRTLGGSIGIAALAAVLKGQFDSLLTGVAEKTPLPPGATAKSLADHPDDIHKLLEPLQHLVEVALSHAIAATFLAAVPLGVVAFVLELVPEGDPAAGVDDPQHGRQRRGRTTGPRRRPGVGHDRRTAHS